MNKNLLNPVLLSVTVAVIIFLGSCAVTVERAIGKEVSPSRAFPEDLSAVLPGALGAWVVEIQAVEPMTGTGEAWLVSYFSEPQSTSGVCVAAGKLVELHKGAGSEIHRVVADEDLALGYLSDDPSASCREFDPERYFMLDPAIDAHDILVAVETVERTKACLLGDEAMHAQCLGGSSSLHLRDAFLAIDPRFPSRVAMHVDEGGFLELWYQPAPDAGVDLLRCILALDEQGMQLHRAFGAQL